jgi:hypothetical protein
MNKYVTVYRDPARPLAPGRYVFRLHWTLSALQAEAGQDLWLQMTTDGWGLHQWGIAIIVFMPSGQLKCSD